MEGSWKSSWVRLSSLDLTSKNHGCENLFKTLLNLLIFFFKLPEIQDLNVNSYIFYKIYGLKNYT